MSNKKRIYFQMQFQHFLKLFLFIVKFSYLSFSKKGILQDSLNFYPGSSKRNKPHSRCNEVFSETFLPGLAHCSLFWMSDRAQMIDGNHLPNLFSLRVWGNHDVLWSIRRVTCAVCGVGLPQRSGFAFF